MKFLTATPALISRAAVLTAAALFCGVLLACNRGPESKPLSIDPKFSINIMPVPAFWPREKRDFPEEPDAANAQREALAEHGRPDFFWFVYNFDRRPILQAEQRYEDQMAGRRAEPLMDWVYMDEKMVLSFDGAKTTRHDLDERIEKLCFYGDPNEVREVNGPGGRSLKRWVYYNYGKQFTFDGSELIGTYDFQPMPGFEARN